MVCGDVVWKADPLRGQRQVIVQFFVRNFGRRQWRLPGIVVKNEDRVGLLFGGRVEAQHDTNQVNLKSISEKIGKHDNSIELQILLLQHHQNTKRLI